MSFLVPYANGFLTPIPSHQSILSWVSFNPTITIVLLLQLHSNPTTYRRCSKSIHFLGAGLCSSLSTQHGGRSLLCREEGGLLRLDDAKKGWCARVSRPGAACAQGSRKFGPKKGRLHVTSYPLEKACTRRILARDLQPMTPRSSGDDVRQRVCPSPVLPI